MLYSKLGVCKLRWGMPCSRPRKRSLLKSCRYLIFPLCVALSSVSVVYALPQGATVESGSATVTQKNATTLDITAANNTIINFSSFNIAPNETVDITMPSNTSKLLARDTGSNESQVLGSLISNGDLILTNPNGINFGPSANVQVNNLIASTLGIHSNDFINSNYVFEHRRGDAYGQVSNAGTITANNLVLQGSSVNNSGVIQAIMGSVHLVSGNKTTVSFDPQGLIRVVINKETSGKLVGVSNAVSNSGQIQAGKVIMQAKTTAEIFESAINQTGEIKATQLVNQNGVIRIIANNDVQVSGNLQAPGGKISISSTERSVKIDQALAAAAQEINISAAKNVKIKATITTQGTTTIKARNNIVVFADIITDSGNLNLMADSDLVGTGSLIQAPGTTIKTTTEGNITIQGSGQNYLANINSAGNVTLQQGGAPAVFNPSSVILSKAKDLKTSNDSSASPQNDKVSLVISANSFTISQGVTLNAGQTTYIVGQNWVNYGNFVPQTSQVILTGPLNAQVLGSTSFYDLIIDPNLNLANFQSGNNPPVLFDDNGNYVPSSTDENTTAISKTVSFDSGATQTVGGALIIIGGYGKLVNINSTNLTIPWLLDILGDYSIDYASIQNTTNINTTGPPIAPLHTQNLLGNSGFDFSNAGPVWLGSTVDLNWSDPNNWDGGFAPGVGDIATFGNSNNNSIIDPDFSGTIAGLMINPTYTGKLIFERSLSLVGPNASVISGNMSSSQAIQITSLSDIVFAGPTFLQAPVISFASQKDIVINAPISAQGNTSFAANNNIYVNANVNVQSGNLSFLADADLDGQGAFIQAPGTTISTIGWGDITIQGSGQNYIGNVSAAGDLILKQGGAPAVFNDFNVILSGAKDLNAPYDSSALPQNDNPFIVSTSGSFEITPGVTVNAGNIQFNVGANWVNYGTFNPQISTVTLTGPELSDVIGDNTFYNFEVEVPGKTVKFDTIAAVDVFNFLALVGGYGNLLTLDTLNPGEQWSLSAPTNTDIEYALIGDSISIRGPPLATLHSDSLGNNTNWNIDPYWVGAGPDANWSDGLNWDSGTAPIATSIVTFDGTSHGVSNANPNKDATVDQNFTIESLTINGYTGTITLNADLTVTGDLTLNSGTLNAASHTITVGGNWTLGNGNFEAGTSTVVFDDATQISNITGNNTFYNLNVLTPAKTLVFQADSMTYVDGTLTIQGGLGGTFPNFPNYVTLESSIASTSDEFGMYINAVSDGNGDPYLDGIIVNDGHAYGPLVPIPTQDEYVRAELNTGWDATSTWTGTTSNLWNLAANWGGTLPVTGNALVFPTATSNDSTSNNFTAGMSFASISFTGSGYTLAGNSIVLTGSIANTASSGTNTISLAISSGAASVTVSTVGSTLVLSGANAFTGGVSVSAGTLDINNASALGTGTFTISGGTIDNTSGAAITTSTNNNAIHWNGSFTFTGSSSLNLGTGAVTINATGYTATASATTLTIGGAVSGATFSFTKAGAGTLILSGIVGTTSGAVTSSAGTLTLSGANTFTGGVTLSGGTLDINNAAALGTGTFIIDAGTTIDNTSGAAITTSTNNNAIHWNGRFTFTGSTSLNLGTGAVTIDATGYTLTDSANTLTIGGAISGAPLVLQQQEQVTLILSGIVGNNLRRCDRFCRDIDAVRSKYLYRRCDP